MIHIVALSACLFFLTIHRLPLWGTWLLIGVGSALWLVARHAGRQTRHGIDALDHYAQLSSLKPVAAALKSTVCLGSLLLCVASPWPLYGVLVFACMMAYTVGLGKTLASYFLSLFQTPVLFMALSSLAILCDVSRTPTGNHWSMGFPGGYLFVTASSQQTALVVLSRALGAVSCLYAYTLSTPMAQTIALLRSIRCPDIILELMYLIYRYIFVLSQLRTSMEAASAARFGNHNLRASYRSLLYCVQNLLFLSFERARIGFDAMEARGYDGKLQFLSDRQRATSLQRALAGGYLLGMGAMFALFARCFSWPF